MIEYNTSVAFGQATSWGFLGSVPLSSGQNPLSPFLAPRWRNLKIHWQWRENLLTVKGFLTLQVAHHPNGPVSVEKQYVLLLFVSSVGISRDSVGRRSRNSFSSNLSLFESSLSWPIFSWNFSQILFSELGGGKDFSQPCVPNVFLYSSGRMDWWPFQLLVNHRTHPLIFSCPEQLNRWPCHWLIQSVTFTFDIQRAILETFNL